MRWSGEWVDDDLDAARGRLRGDCFNEARPHAPSPSSTDSDVRIGMMFGQSERRADGATVNVKNV